MSEQVSDISLRSWGLWALILGSVAMILVFVQMSGVLQGPQPSAATQIGEIAGEMSRAAWRSFFGLSSEAQAPVPPPLLDRVIGLTAPVLGVIAVILAVISGLRREGLRLAGYGLALGGSALVFQFLWWLALAITGVLLLIAIIENIGDIFGGGLFGG